MFKTKANHEALALMHAELMQMATKDDASRDSILSSLSSNLGISVETLESILYGQRPKMLQKHMDSLLSFFNVDREQIKALKDKGYWGPTSYDELDAQRAAEETVGKLWDETDAFTRMVWNILDDPDINDKGSALKTLANEFGNRVDAAVDEIDDPPDDGSDTDVDFDDGIVTFAASTFDHRKLPRLDRSATKQLAIWKENGVWHWAGVYSNNFIDRESEILSAEAHRDFERACKSGAWDMPELWIYHVDIPIGVAHTIAYDEIDKGYGVAYVAGTFHPQFSDIAQELSEKESLGMSHGMPVTHIKRDPTNPLVIMSYRSKEVSVLPREHAANLLTTFNLTKEANKMLNDEQRARFEAMGLSDSAIESLTATGKNLAEAAIQGGMANKDAADEQAVEPEPVIDSALQEDGGGTSQEPAQPAQTPDEIQRNSDVAITVADLESIVTVFGNSFKTLQAEVREVADQLSGVGKALAIMDGKQQTLSEGLELPPAAQSHKSLSPVQALLKDLFPDANIVPDETELKGPAENLDDEDHPDPHLSFTGLYEGAGTFKNNF